MLAIIRSNLKIVHVLGVGVEEIVQVLCVIVL